MLGQILCDDPTKEAHHKKKKIELCMHPQHIVLITQ